MVRRRLVSSLAGGALLGLICVAGAFIRSDFTASPAYVFALWYNRVLIGLAVGAPWPGAQGYVPAVRGAVLGLLVSFAFYSAVGFEDPVSFAAGIVYGALIDLWLSRRGL